MAPPRTKHGAIENDPFAEREARRYESPIASRESILKFLTERGELMTAERIATELALDDPASLDALAKRLWCATASCS